VVWLLALQAPWKNHRPILSYQNEASEARGRKTKSDGPTRWQLNRFGGWSLADRRVRAEDVGEQHRSGEVAAASAMTSRQRFVGVVADLALGRVTRVFARSSKLSDVLPRGKRVQCIGKQPNGRIEERFHPRATNVKTFLLGICVA